MHVNLRQYERTVDFDIVDAGFENFCRQTIYEPELTDAVLRFVHSGDTVIDGGADVGYFTLLMSRLVGDDGNVITFEPNVKSRDVIENNLTINNIDNVAVMPCALWSSNGSRTFHVTEPRSYSSFINYSNSTPEEVATCCIDDIVQGRKIDCIKLDCEGAEGNILLGAEQTLRRGVDAVFVELNFDILPEFGITDHDIRDYMHRLGYDFFLLTAPMPMLVLPSVHLEAPRQCINVLFSTVEKVASVWPRIVIDIRRTVENVHIS